MIPSLEQYQKLFNIREQVWFYSLCGSLTPGIFKVIQILRESHVENESASKIGIFGTELLEEKWPDCLSFSLTELQEQLVFA
jgi:hypothetical protein